MKLTIQNLSPSDLSTQLNTSLGRHVNFSTAGLEVTFYDAFTTDELVLAMAAVVIHEATDWALANAKKDARTQLDELAEVIRTKYLTSAPLQAATYINKARDAANYKGQGYPMPLDVMLYPYVDAEMRAAKDSIPKYAADRIITEATLYDSIKGAAIEFERRVAKIAVGAATTVEGVLAAKATGKVALNVL